MCKVNPETETENEFIQIDISDEDKDILVMAYVEANFIDATKQLFKFNMDEGTSLKECLYLAVINETANVVLREHMEKHTLPLNDGYTNDE